MSRLNALSYLSIRVAISPIGLLPTSLVYTLGKSLGRALYYLLPKFRKRALSNLALAKDLHLTNEEIRDTAKGSFESLATTLLEYGKLSVTRKLEFAECINPEGAAQMITQGKGVIFFCAHQANWEILFLEGTRRMPGVAIGRPIKNTILYKWITSIREKFGGKMITPKEAIREGLRALKQGKFLGIVGDQGMPESSFESTFLGRRAFTSPIPALLAYKTGAPIIFAETIREKNGCYRIHYGEPIYADSSKDRDDEVRRLMESLLNQLESSIKRHPHQWMWQHNRWKQETPAEVFYAYRYDSILIALPPNFDPKLPALIRKIYPRAFLTALSPTQVEEIETIIYSNPSDLFQDDYRFKMVFNFTPHDLKSHYQALSADKCLTVNDLQKVAARRGYTGNLNEEIVKWAICRHPQNF